MEYDNTIDELNKRKDNKEQVTVALLSKRVLLVESDKFRSVDPKEKNYALLQILLM